MSERYTNREYLTGEQYNTASKLAARIRLHEQYDVAGQGVPERFFDVVLGSAPQQAAVLEVGTGRGDLWRRNADRIPAGWHMTLTDLSGGMLRDNVQHIGALANQMRYAVTDVQHLAFKADRFDLIFANYMLYHVPDVERALRELQRVLKPNGIMYALTNGANHMLTMYELAHTVDPSIAPHRIFAHPFSVQTGAEVLEPIFASVAYHPFDSELVVPDAQPIINYIASMISVPGETFVNEKEQALRATIAARIAAEGAIRIHKETGLFIASGSKG